MPRIHEIQQGPQQRHSPSKYENSRKDILNLTNDKIHTLAKLGSSYKALDARLIPPKDVSWQKEPKLSIKQPAYTELILKALKLTWLLSIKIPLFLEWSISYYIRET